MSRAWQLHQFTITHIPHACLGAIPQGRGQIIRFGRNYTCPNNIRRERASLVSHHNLDMRGCGSSHLSSCRKARTMFGQGRDGCASLEANSGPKGPTSLLLGSWCSCSCWYCAGSSGCRLTFVGFSDTSIVVPGVNMICGHPRNHVHHQQSIVTECHWLGNLGRTHYWNAKRNYFTLVTISVSMYSSWTGWWAINWWWNRTLRAPASGSCAGLALTCCNVVDAFLHGLWVRKEMVHSSVPDRKWNSRLPRGLRTRESRAWVWVDYMTARDLQQKQCVFVRSGFGALWNRAESNALTCIDYPFDCKFDRHFEVVTSLRCREMLQIASNCYNLTPRGIYIWWGEMQNIYTLLSHYFWVLDGLELLAICSSSSKAKVKRMECSSFQN